jgi:hypothetical protein
MSAVARLDVYGFHVALRGWPAVVERLRLDFAWFSRPEDGGPAAREVVVEERDPDPGRFGPLRAAFVTPRNVVFQRGDETIVDYFGRALSVYDRRRGRLTVEGRDEQLVHEAAYHFVVAEAAAALESRGLVRLHALGLAGDHGAVAVMLPSGGGKSTLALRALRDPRVRLLSEDSPLMDRSGRLHPFPLRIGVNPDGAGELPAGATRRLERMELHAKLAVEVAHFADRVATAPVPIRHLVIGERSLGTEASLERTGRRTALVPLLREAVVGVGVYQGMEFVLRRGLRDAAGQAGPAAVRTACCAAVLRRAAVWRLVLGRDHDHNWATLAGLLGDGRAR